MTYTDPPSPAIYQCALQLRGPEQGFLFLFLSYFSLMPSVPRPVWVMPLLPRPETGYSTCAPPSLGYATNAPPRNWVHHLCPTQSGLLPLLHLPATGYATCAPPSLGYATTGPAQQLGTPPVPRPVPGYPTCMYHTQSGLCRYCPAQQLGTPPVPHPVWVMPLLPRPATGYATCAPPCLGYATTAPPSNWVRHLCHTQSGLCHYYPAQQLGTPPVPRLVWVMPLVPRPV